ncbi:MAG TPA: S8 family serine peptidase [Frankiaceae bacterium]|nr:S8 family serine peptidase [Frankiaceae bacterium]
MRRSQLLALLAAVVLLAGVGVVLTRRGDRDRPNARPTPSPTGPSRSATPSATPSATVRPTPVGKGPRDREYDVVYAKSVTQNDGAFAVAEAGGEVVLEVPAAGVVTVRAGRDFLQRARTDKRIYGVVPNRAIGRPPVPEEGRDVHPGEGVRRDDNGNDPLADLQWDMDLINAARARRVEAGDPRVLVAVIDTGVDRTHPDLVEAYDTKLSRNFVTDYPAADGPCEEKDCTDPVGVDPGGHGTHVAGTIVAAADGFGMAGVAPGVRLVDLRAGQDSGYFFVMATVRALVYAGDIGVDVANMSFYVDPWLFNCPNGVDDSPDERYEQRAAIEAVRRAVDYARSRGVTLVAAAGNEHMDTDDPTTDVVSPNFPKDTERERRISDDCHVLPTTLPNVVQVSSLARDRVKADYSNYGAENITVTAPGGSFRLADGSAASGNRTLSTYPERLLREEGLIGRDGTSSDPDAVTYCRNGRCAYYRYLVGTSMAAPHAAGVAALIVSKYGTADPARRGQLTMDPREVERILVETATPLPCPDPPTVQYPGRSYSATCRGTRERNSFYGAGLVDALAAVSR